MNKGVSRKSRENKALRPEYIAVYERTLRDKMLFSLAFAKDINFYNTTNTKDGDWLDFFNKDAAFAIVKIISTPITQFKTESDNLLADEDPGEQKIPELLANALAMTTEVVNWYNSLKATNYKGILLGELEALKSDIIPNLKKIEGLSLSYIRSSGEHSKLNKYFGILQSNEMLATKSVGKDAPVTSKQDLINAFDHIYGKMIFLQDRAKESLHNELEERSDHLPHIAMLLTFFKLSEHLEKDINTLTQKHLHHYYTSHLNFKNQGVTQGSGLLEIILKDGLENLRIDEGEPVQLSWGNGQEHTFNIEGYNEIHTARVTEVKSLFKSQDIALIPELLKDEKIAHLLCQAEGLQNANASNKIKEATKFPYTYGSSEDTPSDIGFVVSSPALVLEEGNQEIVVSFAINSPEHCNGRFEELFKEYFKKSFDVYITDERGWKKVFLSVTRYEKGILKFTIPLEKEFHKFISFDKQIHEATFVSQWPCIKILLSNFGQLHPYLACKLMSIKDITIEAFVTGVTSSLLSNPSGNLDNSIPFMPFGPLPALGSYLEINNPRVFQSTLKELCLRLHWSGLPQTVHRGFATYYEAYPDNVVNKSFRAILTQNRTNVYSSGHTGKQEIQLFRDKDGYLLSECKIDVALNEFPLSNRMHAGEKASNADSKPLYMVLSNPSMGFGHQLFPEIYAERVLKASRFRKREIALPKTPYTPVLEKLTLDYKNVVKENLKRKQDISNTDIEFFHIYPFGHITTFPGSLQMVSYLFPQIERRGNVFIGVENVTASARLNMGFDLVPATWIHTDIRKPTIIWEYLRYNEWVPFGEFLLVDSTGGLSASGVVKLRLPEVVQYDNTRMPQGQFWIRASFDSDETVNSRIKKIFAQAVSISGVIKEYESDKSYDGNVKVSLINTVLQKQVARISEPYAFNIEDSKMTIRSFYNGISERLRHKNRAVTNWDIERLVLDKFKEVDKLRVFGRCNSPYELVIGNHLQVVVIPKVDSGVQNTSVSVKISLAILEKIKQYLKGFVSPHLKISVSNALYERLKVRCRVKFMRPENSGYLRDVLNNDLINFISPYLDSDYVDKGFDEQFSKMEILNFIEGRRYVDEVTHFSVLQLVEVDGTHRIIDTAEIYGEELPNILFPITPYVILSSVAQHHIEIMGEEPVGDKYKITGIGDIAIGTDFIMTDKDGKYIDQ